MPEPIMPNPMNPIFIPPSLVRSRYQPALFLLEHIFGDQCRGHRRRPAGIKGEMGDHFAELVFREAIVESPLQMTDELLFAAARDQSRAGDQATVTLREAGPLPDFTEQHPFAEVYQARHDIANLVAGSGWLRLRHGFLLLDAEFQSLARASTPPAINS